MRIHASKSVMHGEFLNFMSNDFSTVVNVPDSISLFSTPIWSGSVNMATKAHITAKPLETGRQMFSWFCIDAIDEPLSNYQVLGRKIFRLFYVVICCVLVVIFNAVLFKNSTSMMNDINELFYGLFQLNSTLEAVACVFAIFMSGRKLASLFRILDNIYKTCKVPTLLFLLFGS